MNLKFLCIELKKYFKFWLPKSRTKFFEKRNENSPEKSWKNFQPGNKFLKWQKSTQKISVNRPKKFTWHLLGISPGTWQPMHRIITGSSPKRTKNAHKHTQTHANARTKAGTHGVWPGQEKPYHQGRQQATGPGSTLARSTDRNHASTNNRQSQTRKKA